MTGLWLLAIIIGGGIVAALCLYVLSAMMTDH